LGAVEAGPVGAGFGVGLGFGARGAVAVSQAGLPGAQVTAVVSGTEARPGAVGPAGAFAAAETPAFKPKKSRKSRVADIATE